MDIVVMGLSHRTAPVEVREKFAFPEGDLTRALGLLKERDQVKEGVILSTCNRVEIYSLMENPEDEILREFLCDYHGFEDDISGFLYFYRGEAAVIHLCRVSAGLDSMVIGEPQIFGQVKDAYEKALECDSVGAVLNKLFHQAFNIVKKVRTETGIGRSAVSVSFAAVELAKKIFSDIREKNVMILGAGEMGELTVRHLISSGVSNVLVANRTYERAVGLAEEFQGVAIRYEEVLEYIPKIDILISSTGAPHYVISYRDMGEIIHLRKNTPIFFVDIAVPRNIDPRVNDIENVFLYDIDDLQAVVDSNIRMRVKEAGRAEDIIAHEAKEFMKWLGSQEIVPTIISLRSRAEEIRQREFDKIVSKIDISDGDREKVEFLTKSIVKKILHHPMIRLREYANNGHSKKYSGIIKDLFSLEDGEPVEKPDNRKPGK